MSAPSVLAYSVQQALAFCESHREESRAKIIDRLPSDTARLIERARPTDWIPIEHDRHVPSAIVAEFGEIGAVDLWRRFLPAHLESPFLSKLVDVSQRSFRFDPATVAWTITLGWPLIYRSFGAPKVANRTKTSALIEFHNVPTEALRHAPYILSWRAFFAATFDLCGVDGEISSDLDRGAETLALSLQWRSKGRADSLARPFLAR